MTPDKTIELLNDEQNNATELEASRVIYLPDDDLPICYIGYMKHIESRMRYHQVVKMTSATARSLANALLIQTNVADTPPPSF
jgi:predicted GIY-YIG superfamily endonuclease